MASGGDRPVGRFAPSPTGALHLGSLTTAVASFCHIKSQGGLWRLRIEDTDFERCRPEYSAQMLRDLDNLGLHWDGAVRYQSQRLDVYAHYLQKIDALCYPCSCSRKKLESKTRPVYPRYCLPSAGAPKTATNGQKIRLQLPDVDVCFFDGVQGVCWQNPQKLLGDTVIKRSNGVVNYIFACAIDDALDGVTCAMRGLDILPMTAAQGFIQQLLGLPTIDRFFHLPLLLSAQGQKLSKQNLARPIDTTKPGPLLFLALRLLRQNPPADLKTDPKALLLHAVAHWDNTPLLGKRALTQHTLPF